MGTTPPGDPLAVADLNEVTVPIPTRISDNPTSTSETGFEGDGEKPLGINDSCQTISLVNHFRPRLIARRAVFPTSSNRYRPAHRSRRVQAGQHCLTDRPRASIGSRTGGRYGTEGGRTSNVLQVSRKRLVEWKCRNVGYRSESPRSYRSTDSQFRGWGVYTMIARKRER